MRYRTKGVCATFIDYEIIDGKVCNVQYYGGCPGGGQAVAKLVDGMPIAEAVKRMRDINCGGRGTSCADQLSRALQEHL